MFTAARIAEALGVDPQLLALRLRHVPFSGQVKSGGKQVRAWAWRALDEETRRQLNERASAAGFGDGEQLLTHGTADWMTVPARDRDRATRLSHSFRAALAAHSVGGSREDVERLAAEGYRKEHGYDLKPGTIRKLLDRVLQMDAGARQFERLHLYLPARCFATPAPASPGHPELFELHRPMDLHTALVQDQANPSRVDRQLLLSAAFHHFDRLVADRQDLDPGVLKMSLVDYLLRQMPGLAASREAARKLFDWHYAKWQENGRNHEALSDGRTVKAERPYHVCPKCLKDIHDAAAQYHGRVTLAYRELRKRGKLCEACMSRVKFKPREDKSYMPKGLRRRVTPAPLTLDFLRSPREAELNGPHSERDYQGLEAGVRYVFDDLTTNERTVEPRQQVGALRLPGNRWEFYKCQIIAAEDFASAKWLDFVIHYGHPTAWSIQKLFLNIFSNPALGMPDKGLYLERGVFKAAVASQRMVENSFDIRQTLDYLDCEVPDDGQAVEVFESMRIRRAKLAPAKTIEGSFRHLQDRAAMLPGHLGFNEREAKFDSLFEFMERCRSGKEDPRQEGILTIEELGMNYRRLMEEMNSEPQNGRRLRGLSPNEKWSGRFGQRPTQKLPDALRYLFSTHGPITRTVTGKGIVISKIDGVEDAVYYGHPRLGELAAEGKKVQIFYNKLEPAVITVRVGPKESFTLNRQKYPADSASREQMKAMNQARWNHLRPSRIIAGQVGHPLGFTIEREDNFPEAQLEMGRQHNLAVEEAASSQSGEDAEIAAIRRRARAMGLQLDRAVNLGSPRIRQAVLMQLDAAEASGDTTS